MPARVTVTRAYKTELDLNNRHVTACKKHAGAARWAYNWGLQRKQKAYCKTGTSPSAIDLHRELNALKQTDVSWMYEVSKCAPQEALRNLDRAFDGFFRRVKLQKARRYCGRLGYPQPKSKQQGLGSFRLTGSIVIYRDAIQLPRLGRLRLKEHGYLPTTGTVGITVLSATVSEQAGRWYVSVQVEQEQEQVVPVNSGPVVGVDLGVKALATLSDGTVIPNPRPLKRRLKTIKRLHRSVSRKHKGSKNRTKSVHRLTNAYRQAANQRAANQRAANQRAANQRANMLHQVTTWLAKTTSVIVIEDLHVAGMLQNQHLAQAIGDVGVAEFRGQLTYKAAWYGSQVVVASRWEPSSKTCSGCGWEDDDLELSDRVFVCRNPERSDCGLVLDRDLNAASNLARFADSAQLAGSSSESQNAGGGESAGRRREAAVNLSSVKQESTPIYPCAG